jgi:hypothetical protein
MHCQARMTFTPNISFPNLRNTTAERRRPNRLGTRVSRAGER